MLRAIRKKLIALVGLAFLAGLGVWLVRSKTDPRRASTDSSASLDDRAEQAPVAADEPADSQPDAMEEASHFAPLRQRMVDTQIQARGIRNAGVLEAMRTVPRHRFVPPGQVHAAYNDHPLRIGHGQTISQPYIVALMTELAKPTKESIALDVGTGSGYQAAVLSNLCKEVYSIEIIESLANSARQRLEDVGYENLTVRCGDGYRGWPEKAPFDLIIVAAAPDHVPQPLVDQLREGGRLIIPVGSYFQELMVVEKLPGGKSRAWKKTGVAFVPMTGEAQERRKD
ncbi:MAG: protein-L-isoaspartate(D-aspartate) O-methyltransferase [Pirellulaceae bacterium]